MSHPPKTLGSRTRCSMKLKTQKKGVTSYSLLMSQQQGWERNSDLSYLASLADYATEWLCSAARSTRLQDWLQKSSCFKQKPVILMPNSQLQENSGEGSQELHWFESGLKSDEKKAVLHWVLGTAFKVEGGRLEGSLTSPSSFESSCPQERKSSYLAKGMTGSGSSRR